MTMTKPERRCPMCGVEPKRIATSRHRPICSNLDCGLPVALWPSVGAGMECANHVVEVQESKDGLTRDDWSQIVSTARRALRGGKP